MQCERITAKGFQCIHEAKDGNKLCPIHIGQLKANHGRTPRLPESTKKEIAARKLLHAIVQENGLDKDIVLREWTKDFNPFDALIEMAQELYDWKNICLGKLARLKEDEWRWDGDRAGEQLRSEVAMYERAVDRVVKTLERIARLGIEDRLMRIQERQVAIVENAFIRALQDLDLPVDIQAKARVRIVAHLREH